MTKLVNYKNLPHSGYLLAEFHGFGPFVKEVGNLAIQTKKQRFNDFTLSTFETLCFKAKHLVNKYYYLYGNNPITGVGIIDLSESKTWDRVYKMMKGSKD